MLALMTIERASKELEGKRGWSLANLKKLTSEANKKNFTYDGYDFHYAKGGWWIVPEGSPIIFMD